MAVSFVKTFSQQGPAAEWAALMHAKGYSIAISDVCDDVQLLKEDGSDWANPPKITNGYFVVLAFNKDGKARDAA